MLQVPNAEKKMALLCKNERSARLGQGSIPDRSYVCAAGFKHPKSAYEYHTISANPSHVADFFGVCPKL